MRCIVAKEIRLLDRAECAQRPQPRAADIEASTDDPGMPRIYAVTFRKLWTPLEMINAQRNDPDIAPVFEGQDGTARYQTIMAAD